MQFIFSLLIQPDFESTVEINLEIDKLQSTANRDKELYDEIKKFIDERHYEIGVNDCKMAMLGPKGAGKSTYLWMIGASDEKPKNVIGDGTTEVFLSRSKSVADTIGIDFNYHMLMKMLAVFIRGRHFPDTLVICCNPHQVKQAISVLALVGISRYYLVCLNVETALRERNSPSSYNFHVLEEAKQLNPSLIPVNNETELCSLDSLRELKGIFPNYEVKLGTYEDFKFCGVQEVTKYWICRYIYEIKTKYNNDYKAMLNDTGL